MQPHFIAADFNVEYMNAGFNILNVGAQGNKYFLVGDFKVDDQTLNYCYTLFLFGTNLQAVKPN